MLALGSASAWAQPPATQLPVLRPGSSPINAVVGTPTGGANPLLNITQTASASNRALIEWSSFSIGAKAKVDIAQPNAQSILVNRVTGSGAGGAAPSEIYGAMTANGRVFLVNPSGIVFGPGAQVNTGALVASTLDLADSMTANHYAGFLNGGSVELGQSGANDGGTSLRVLAAADPQAPQIQVSEGGSIVLLSRDKVGQGGVVSAPQGSVDIALAQRASVQPLSSSGYVELLNLQAPTAAASITLDSASQTLAHGGVVRIDAGADGAVQVLQDSLISASGSAAGATGGDVSLQGRSVELGKNGAVVRVQADGAAGGGRISVGGA